MPDTRKKVQQLIDDAGMEVNDQTLATVAAAMEKETVSAGSRVPKGREEAVVEALTAPPAPEADAEDPEEQESATIQVAFTVMGTATSVVELDEGSTVGDLLVEAGLSAKTGTVLVNSQVAQLDDPLSDGVGVVFANPVAGGRC